MKTTCTERWISVHPLSCSPRLQRSLSVANQIPIDFELAVVVA
jgi:hypothetical protein